LGALIHITSRSRKFSREVAALKKEVALAKEKDKELKALAMVLGVREGKGPSRETGSGSHDEGSGIAVRNPIPLIGIL